MVADEIKSGLKKLPIDDRQGTSEDKLKGVTRKQKSDLIDASELLRLKMMETLSIQGLDLTDTEALQQTNTQTACL